MLILDLWGIRLEDGGEGVERQGSAAPFEIKEGFLILVDSQCREEPW